VVAEKLDYHSAMGKKKAKLPEALCLCLRCGHYWMKRIVGRPVRCPECKEHDWDIEAGIKPMGRPRKNARNGR
jgi:predicted Zn-ribbon and HTH transcriptional regulator